MKTVSKKEREREKNMHKKWRACTHTVRTRIYQLHRLAHKH